MAKQKFSSVSGIYLKFMHSNRWFHVHWTFSFKMFFEIHLDEQFKLLCYSFLELL